MNWWQLGGAKRVAASERNKQEALLQFERLKIVVSPGLRY